MPDQPPALNPASPAEARRQLQAILAQLTDAEALALGRLVCVWVTAPPAAEPRRL